MSVHHTVKYPGVFLLALALLNASPISSHAIEPRFELNAEVLNKRYPIRHSRTDTTDEPRSAGTVEVKSRNKPKPGDRYKARSSKRVHAQKSASRSRKGKKSFPAPFAEHLVKRSKVVGGTADEVVRDVRRVWTQLVPSPPGSSDRFGYSSSAFSLSLDPAKYPVIPASDGGSILLDGNGTIPSLVESLIQEKNPTVRVVSENTDNRREFYRSLLSAARFYSFEEDFFVGFGTDPNITMHADFKIEKSADSLLRQDLVLLNVADNRRRAPEGLVKFLAGNGFRLLETATPSREGRMAADNLLYVISEKKSKNIVDSLLNALDVKFQTGTSVDLYARDDIGIRLEVSVDRYFEDKGRRFVVAVFNGDPVTYTLVRLLETKGYRVIMLKEGDDLRSVTDNLFSGMEIPARYGEHDLWSAHEVGYGVRMSGVMVPYGRNQDRNVFFTDRNLDPVTQELINVNGYRLGGRRGF